MAKSVVKWLLRQQLRSATVRKWLAGQLTADVHKNTPQLRFAAPGHFYSPLPNPEDIDKQAERLYALPSADDGVNLNVAAQRQLLLELAAYSPEFDWEEQPKAGRRYWMKNDFFAHGDAAVLFSMLRWLKPRRIIEVGSGFSSALMLDTNDLYCDPKMELLFIDPHPERLETLLTQSDRSSVRLIPAPVQDVPVGEFAALDHNDILFIDSSHVSKTGSDVNHLLFCVLPHLRAGVVVHFHDMFFPYEYPLVWVRAGCAWNELYLLRAFLQYNRAFDILLFNSYLCTVDPTFVKSHMPLLSINGGASLWLRKQGRPAP